MAHRVAVINNKGGVGKTKVTVNLAAAIARAGHYVLVIDMDPQGNLTRRIAAVLTDESPTVAEAIEEGSKKPGCAAGAITTCGWTPDPGYAERIHVIPATPELQNRDENGTGMVRRLAKAMQGVDDAYTVTLIDCPPNLGILTQMALAAANSALEVTEPEYDSIESALRIIDFIALNRDDLYNPGLRPLGLIVNKVDTRLRIHNNQIEALPGLVSEQLAQSFPGQDMSAVQVWQPHLPSRTAFSRAIESAAPIEYIGRDGEEFAALYNPLGKRLLAEAEAA